MLQLTLFNVEKVLILNVKIIMIQLDAKNVVFQAIIGVLTIGTV